MKSRLLKSIFCMLLLSSLLCTLPVGSDARASISNIKDGTVLNFTVMRKNEEIGSHVMKFRRTGDVMTVDIKTDVEVKLLFVPVYSFNHESREVWDSGMLSRLTSKTNDDGTKHVLLVEGTSILNIDGDGASSTAPRSTPPASLWHPVLTHPGPAKILNTLDGHIMAINTQYVGDEVVAVHSETVKAKHYSITGELEREVWVDPEGLLVKVRFKGSDGSGIEYLLK